jgi:hypothetical protein
MSAEKAASHKTVGLVREYPWMGDAPLVLARVKREYPSRIESDAIALCHNETTTDKERRRTNDQ